MWLLLVRDPNWAEFPGERLPAVSFAAVRQMLSGVKQNKWEEQEKAWDTPLQRKLSQAQQKLASALASTVGNEAEAKAARRLGKRPVDIARAAHTLWGRSLTDEREIRSDSSTAQARGAITKVLYEELRRYFENEEGLPKPSKTRSSSRKGKGKATKVKGEKGKD